MSRSARVAVALLSILIFVHLATAQQERPRRPPAPMLTNDDLVSPRSATPVVESEIHTSAMGSPLRNPRAILESAILKISELNTVRTRMQALLPNGPVDVIIESVKPDRMHYISPYGEMISIGRKVYVKRAAGWSVSSENAQQADSGLDFRTLVKQFIQTSGVRITGQLLGEQTVDGIDTVAYVFEVSDNKETGKVELHVGKDGYIRQMFLSSGSFNLKLWFSSLNEPLTIEPPL